MFSLHYNLFLGPYNVERLSEAMLDISKQLGPIFRLNLSGSTMVVSLNADDAKTLFLSEGKFPTRTSFDALIHYRRNRFNSIGVVPSEGEEWYKFRGAITPLLNTKLIRSYSKRHEDVANRYVQYIRTIRNGNNYVEDLYQHLLRYAVEGD